MTLLIIVTEVADAAVLSLSRAHPKHNHPHQLSKDPLANFFVLPRSCVCKNWMQTYQSGAVTCGQGPEFYFKTGSTKGSTYQGPINALNISICKQFYEVLNFNKCVNLNMGKDKGQWCYVDAACQDLRHGEPVQGTNLSWKKCEQGPDDRLRDFPVRALETIAIEHDVDLGLLHKMSYPLSKAGEGLLFPEVESFWGLGKNSSESLPKSLSKEMQYIAESNWPYSFDNSDSETVPHTIVVGMKVYRVEESPNRNETHPGTWAKLTCINGCY